jgi:plastocyanin
MRMRTGLGLGAAAAALLSFAAGALATGNPQPFSTTTYAAPTVALSSGGNTAALPPGSPNYFTIAGTTVKAGDVIQWVAPTGNNWVFNGAPNCTTNTATLTGALTGNGTNTLTCTLAGAGTATFVQANNAGGAFAVALQGPLVAQLANANIIFPSSNILITAQNTAAAGGGTVPDPAPIPNLTLASQSLYFFNNNSRSLQIDLTGNGLPAIPPGAGFDTTPDAVQPVVGGVPSRTVSTAGFLGSVQVGLNTFETDARNGLSISSNDPLFTNGSLTGSATMLLFGDFATLTDAYLLPNTSSPAGTEASCVPTRPANAIQGAINAAKNTIAFAAFSNAGSPSSFGTAPVFAVCLVTNGTQVIQQSNGGPGGSFGIGLIASITVSGISGPIPLTRPNDTFGNISYQGSVFFAQNVFGANNNYPVFFRAVNQGNTAAQIWAVLTKDVPNVVPETGAGSCSFPAGGTTAPVTASCNISFVANLTGVTDPSGLSKGLLQPNTGTYYLADQIAALAGTTLPAGNPKATIFLLSPNAGISFSALSQNVVTNDIISLP